MLPTHTFRVAVAVAFYFNKLFGLPSASQLHFSYTNFSGGRGFAFYRGITSWGRCRGNWQFNTFTWYHFFHMVAIFWHHLLGAMSRKLAIFMRVKYVHTVQFFGKK